MRESDGKTLDICVVRATADDPGGYADAAAQDAFCKDTYCWITVLYDQSGKGNHLYQAPRGGFSGPAIFPIAVRMVNDVYNAVDLPIMGMGGIASAEDVIEMIMAGADAVQIGAANLTDPWICKKIIERLPSLMEELGISSLKEIKGCAK
jgi:dihydroorotate dehydrogenase